MAKKWTRVLLPEFLERAKTVHGQYDYSLVQFTRLDTKVDIICPIHGVFTQSAKYHLDGNGCKQCGNSKRSITTALTKERIRLEQEQKQNSSNVLGETSQHINLAWKPYKQGKNNEPN